MTRGRVVVLAAVAAGVLAGTSGCGFADALAHPQAQQQPGDAAVTPAPVAAPTTPADRPGTVAQATLLARGRQVGTVEVTTEPVQTGYVPPIREFGLDCPVSGPSLQYIAVDLRFDLQGDDGPAGHLGVSPGPTTPADTGDLGVFFRPDQDDVTGSCGDYPPLPTTDTFWARGTSQVTGYVVLDQAVGPATPQGRAEVFPTLQLRLSDLRLRDYDGSETPLAIGALTVGAVCADDGAALCLPG